MGNVINATLYLAAASGEVGGNGQVSVWIPVVVAVVSGIFGVLAIKVGNTARRDVKPIKEILQNTKLQGDGSLVEALTILRKDYRNAQVQHQEDVKYFVEQIRGLRKDVADRDTRIERQDEEIAHLKKQLADHEKRLNQSHIGEGA